MTMGEAIKYLQQLYPNGGHCWLDEQRIEAIGMAIQALQEEPVSEELEKASIIHSEIVRNTSVIDEDFIGGAKWQKEQMTAKAIDVEVKMDAGGYPYIPQMELYDYDKDMPLAKKGDKYKVVLIKEE